MRALVVSFGAAVWLSGCTMGIQQGADSPTVSYTVPRNYQEVYLRVQNQASECLRGKGHYDVYAEVDSAMQTGVVAVRSPLGAEVARTEIKAVDARNTQVSHSVWGRSPWDAAALGAMRQSVVIDTSVCVAYK